MKHLTSFCFFAFAIGLATGARAEPRGVRLTLDGDPTSTIAVSWNSDSAGENQIIYGTSPTSLGTSLTAQQTFTMESPLNNAFSAKLTGLTPSTTYYYRVGSPGSYHPPEGEDPFHFTTMSADPCEPFSFIVIGDNRADFDGTGPNPNWEGILAEAMAHAPLFFVNTGDMVKNGDAPVEWSNFIDMSEPGFALVPSILSIGNHDDEGDNGPTSHYAQLFEFPHNPQNDYESYYSLDIGPIHFVNLDSTLNGTSFADMVVWLGTDLAATDKPWKMVVQHHSIYSRGNHFTGEEFDGDRQGYLNAELIPLYDANDVDLVFSGHSHNYERYAPTVGVDPEFDSSAVPRSFPAGAGSSFPPGSVLPDGATGTSYVVSGGAGALTTELGVGIECLDAGCSYCFSPIPLGDCIQEVWDRDKDGMAVYSGAHNFVVFYVDGAQLSAEAWTTNTGNIGDVEMVDSFTMTSTDFGDLCDQPGTPDAGPSTPDANTNPGPADANVIPGNPDSGAGANGDRSGGCGCRAVGSGAAGGNGLLLLLAVLALVTRGRFPDRRG